MPIMVIRPPVFCLTESCYLQSKKNVSEELSIGLDSHLKRSGFVLKKRVHPWQMLSVLQ